MNSPITCGRCLEDPPPFAQCIVPFRYTYPIDSLVKAVKFGGQLTLASQLGKLLAGTLESRLELLPECLISIPLHRQRLGERGYNQSLELARPIAKQFDLPLNFRDCVRIRNTEPQAQLSASQRRLNVRSAFAIQRQLKYRHVALIDDVITTGHTVVELSSQLLKQGVERVDVWALSRAQPL
jgi:ComF family protein